MVWSLRIMEVSATTIEVSMSRPPEMIECYAYRQRELSSRISFAALREL